MTLNEAQINVLLKLFPKNCNGAESIARKLLTTGMCIVAGTEPIWRGGVGNYIVTKDAEGAVGCSEYKMNVNSFVTSNWVQEYLKEEMDGLNVEIQERQKHLTSIMELIKESW